MTSATGGRRCFLKTAVLTLIGAVLAAPAVVTAQTGHDCNDPFSSGIILNCGFEDPTPFNWWIVTNTPAPLLPWTVLPAGAPPTDPRFFSIAPTEGLVAGCHGFDGQVGLFRMAQDLNLLGIGVSTVEFDYRAAWDLTWGATLPRIFEVNIEPFGGGTPWQSTVIFTAQAGTTVLDTGARTATVDVSQFGGGMIRLSFDAIIPEITTGPALFQLDNIQIHPPAPVDGGDLLGTTGQALNQLIGIDESTGDGVFRYQLGQYNMVTDIAFREDGTVFGATGNGSANIIAIDPDTGQEVVIGNFGSGIVMGLGFVGGVLYGTFETLPSAPASDLVIVDQSTGALTTVGSTGFQLVEGLAYDDRTGTLYGVTSGAAGGDLITIDLATGAGTLVGATGFSHVAALGFHQRVLYGGLDMGAGVDAGKLITIDTSTGVGTAVGPTGWAALNGIAFAPILFSDNFESGDTSAWHRSVP
jgi:hypothetical protein